MRRLMSTRLWIVLIAFGGAAVLPSPGGDTDRRVPALLKQLGDDDYRAREAASKELQHAGEKALPAVITAANSENPEVRRARTG